MAIKGDLIIEDNSKINTINFIKSGAFVKVYNRSFYLLTEKLGRPLQVKLSHVVSCKNRFVVSGGFPEHKVLSDYPQAVKTEWGYQLCCQGDDKAYQEWLLRHEVAAIAAAQAVASVGKSC